MRTDISFCYWQISTDKSKFQFGKQGSLAKSKNCTAEALSARGMGRKMAEFICRDGEISSFNDSRTICFLYVRGVPAFCVCL